ARRRREGRDAARAAARQSPPDQRDSAALDRGAAEIAARGLRAHRVRGAVEGASGGGERRRRESPADPARGHRQPGALDRRMRAPDAAPAARPRAAAAAWPRRARSRARALPASARGARLPRAVPAPAAARVGGEGGGELRPRLASTDFPLLPFEIL